MIVNYVDVVVPGPWWNTLTYTFEGASNLAEGVRVKVPVRTGKRVGFVCGAGEAPPPGHIKLKPLEAVLDDVPVLGDELWNLAGWMGNTFLCGAGEALLLICPAQILRGDSFSYVPSRLEDQDNRAFHEVSFYNPVDGERFAYYRDALSEGGKRTLLLFPEVEMASAFFAGMSEALKSDALLWPSGGGKKLWDAWKRTASGEARVVVGSSGAAFVPLCFDEAIVDDESNPAYILPRAPKISARSIVGRRALTLKAKLILGGRMPSARTYMRSKPEYHAQPQRSNLVFVDARSFKKETPGVEGGLPIAPSLIERTESVLAQGRWAFWIMDRKGQAGEVYCCDCGASLCCLRCKGTTRSESRGDIAGLRCLRCGERTSLPSRCPACRGSLLLGKRPGLEALLPLAAKFMKGRPVILGEPGKPGKNSGEPSLMLGTRGLLSLCDSLDVGLVAWLDPDAEARKADYNARFQAFSMVWESCWRGLQNGERVVLMQVRGSGDSWRNVLRLGWGHFWKGELREREKLGLPPYGLLVQIDLPKNENKRGLIESLERENIMAMDSGEENSPLWVAAKSTERLRVALAPRFEISRSGAGFPVVTVLSE
ncbi:MAG: hypothetical protein FWG71_02100 [Synergistaceae bacterium]|nr:hypothetical protein [Synergistaceae bacterium]